MKNFIKKGITSAVFLSVFIIPMFVEAQVTPTLNYIWIQTQATKTEYAVGDDLDISGLVVNGNYTFEDRYNELVSIIVDDITGFDSSATTTSQTLTITYGGKTVTYNISVVAAPLESIAVRVPATKTVYTVGETLDISGLIVCGSYKNRPSCDEDLSVTAGNITGFDSSVATSTQTLTITYGGKTTSYTISIEEPQISNRVSGSRRQIVTTVSTTPTAVLSSSNDQIYTDTSGAFNASSTSEFIFKNNLGYGMRNEEVRILQERLRAEGFFTFHTSTGYFGPITLEAVKAYQKAKGIPFVTGFVGPLTRAELNK